MSQSNNLTPHLLVTLIGDVQTEPFARVKYGYLLKALEKKYSISVCDATLHGISRIWNAMQTFHPNTQTWKSRFYQNVPAFHFRSQTVERFKKAHKGSFDLIFQVGVLFDSTRISTEIPSIIYTDYTSQLARNKPGLGRMPMNEAMYQKWFSLEKDVFHRAVHIFTRGSTVRQSVIDHYGVPPDMVTAVGGGVNLDMQTAHKKPTPPGSPIILFIGKEFYRKGGDLVLEAFSQVKGAIPNAKLWMVTDEPLHRETLLEGVTLLPPTWDRDVIANLFMQADCFVLASRLETWGDVLLEAMAYHLPCIGVSGESMEDIIEDQKTGLIVPSGNVPALAQAMIKLLQNPELMTAMGEEGFTRVSKIFTWDHVVNQMGPLIENIIKQRLN